jgi:hypothetical protein
MKAGGGVGWTTDCRAALISCGVNPDNFGTYDERYKAQKKLRDEYTDQRDKEAAEDRRKHEPSCPRNSGGACRCYETDVGFNDFKDKHGSILPWMEANSQSGHISNDAFYRDPGTRDDPCGNVRPTYQNGQPVNAGGYGYQGDKALCMDHFGRSNDNGSMHQQICELERNQSNSIKANGDGTVSEAQMTAGAQATATVAVNGADARQNGQGVADFDTVQKELKPAGKTYNQELSQLQKDQAAELQAKEGTSGISGQAATTDGANPNSASGPGPDDATKQKAIKCITEAWQKSMITMRNSTVNEHSTVGKSPECKAAIEAHNAGPPKADPPAQSYSDLPPDKRAALNDQMAAKVAARQKELEQKGAMSAGEAKNPPTKEDCLEYQANWLDSHRDQGGNFPPPAGTAQGVAGPTTVPKTPVAGQGENY